MPGSYEAVAQLQMASVTCSHLSDPHCGTGKSPGCTACRWPAKRSPAGSSAPFGSAPLAPPAVELSAAARSACLWQQFLHSRWHVHPLGCQGELSGEGRVREESEAGLLPLNARLAADLSTFLFFKIQFTY